MLHSYLSKAFCKDPTKQMLQCSMLHAAKSHTSVLHCSIRLALVQQQSADEEILLTRDVT